MYVAVPVVDTTLALLLTLCYSLEISPGVTITIMSIFGQRPYKREWTPADGLNLSVEAGAKLLYNPKPSPAHGEPKLPTSIDGVPSNVHLSDFMVGYIKTALKDCRPRPTQKVLHEKFGNNTWLKTGTISKSRQHMGHAFVDGAGRGMHLDGYVLTGDNGHCIIPGPLNASMGYRYVPAQAAAVSSTAIKDKAKKETAPPQAASRTSTAESSTSEESAPKKIRLAAGKSSPVMTAEQRKRNMDLAEKYRQRLDEIEIENITLRSNLRRLQQAQEGQERLQESVIAGSTTFLSEALTAADRAMGTALNLITMLELMPGIDEGKLRKARGALLATARRFVASLTETPKSADSPDVHTNGAQGEGGGNKPDGDGEAKGDGDVPMEGSEAVPVLGTAGEVNHE